jgi:hypothetical protein
MLIIGGANAEHFTHTGRFEIAMKSLVDGNSANAVLSGWPRGQTYIKGSSCAPCHNISGRDELLLAAVLSFY